MKKLRVINMFLEILAVLKGHGLDKDELKIIEKNIRGIVDIVDLLEREVER